MHCFKTTKTMDFGQPLPGQAMSKKVAGFYKKHLGLMNSYKNIESSQEGYGQSLQIATKSEGRIQPQCLDTGSNLKIFFLYWVIKVGCDFLGNEVADGPIGQPFLSCTAWYGNPALYH